jgi:hypothetical protein
VVTNKRNQGKVMKTLLNIFLDGLTYKDLAGKRHPRIYAVLTVGILFLLALLSFLSSQQKRSMMDEVQVTPASLQVKLEQTATLQPTQSIVEICPPNPDDWIFTNILPDDNFKRIEPVCVYERLGKTVAWAIALRSGFTRAEAAQSLGFNDFPMRQLDEVMALTDTKGPLMIPITFIPPVPDFAEWQVTGDGRLAIVYAVRGCFRTYKVVGNQAQYWEKDYPVMCVLSQDLAGSQNVFQLAGHTYTTSAEPTRSFALFGYTTAGSWVWLGTQKESKVSLTKIPNFLEDARVSAGLSGLPVWDAAWMGEKYLLPSKTLPGSWQTMKTESDRQAILDGLNKFMSQK